MNKRRTSVFEGRRVRFRRGYRLPTLEVLECDCPTKGLLPVLLRQGQLLMTADEFDDLHPDCEDDRGLCSMCGKCRALNDDEERAVFHDMIRSRVCGGLGTVSADAIGDVVCYGGHRSTESALRPVEQPGTSREATPIIESVRGEAMDGLDVRPGTSLIDMDMSPSMFFQGGQVAAAVSGRQGFEVRVTEPGLSGRIGACRSVDEVVTPEAITRTSYDGASSRVRADVAVRRGFTADEVRHDCFLWFGLRCFWISYVHLVA
ncbi:hypothetical protein BV25DRAFT_1838609 [Artomyces pyxidatus]|uniref:Uncharacterized protein n=1 Tax=Artomyces pyxidatus TaxID=48021 RepID=A0ACB8T1N2_9AGAM|nr:hypothetical protein BV25DRAFT_1838609 [Artomyces pyxidatus]